MQTDNCLTHHGTLGMKHGRRRYQYPDGTLTPEGKIRYGVGTSLKKKAKAEKSKAEKMQEGRKRAAEERAKKKEYEEAKERAIAKGKASDVMKFQGDLTHDQMQRVITRLQDEENLAKYVAKEKPTIRKKIEAASETMSTMGKSVNNAVEFGRSVHNAIKFAKQITGKDEDSQNKRIQKIAEHGTAEQVQKNSYKLNSKQIKAAKERLANIEKINQQHEQEQKKADKAAEEKVKQKDAQNRAKAAKEEAKRQAEYDARLKESAHKAYQNMTYEDRQRLAEYARRKRIKSMKNQQAIVRRMTFN